MITNRAVRTKMECYICRSAEARTEFYAEENGFKMVRCLGCGLLFVEERPTDEAMTQAHQVGQHAGEELLDTTGGFRNRKVPMYVKILKDLYGHQEQIPPNWLDIGCGHGEFLQALHNFSGGVVNAIGIEPNVIKRESGRQRGLKIECFDLDQCKQKYECISLLNVFSHLTDPPEILRRWSQLLRPSAEILLQTGDSAHLPAEQQLRPLLLPDHLSFASEKIVVEMLEDIGFDIVRICKYPYVPKTLGTLVRETAKLALGRKSHLAALFGKDQLGRTDMYIRARLRKPLSA